MKDKLINLSNTLKKYIETFKYNLKNSNSFVYSFIIVVVLIGYGFFLNSNEILKDDGTDYTTPLFEVKKVDNANVELRERKYCKASNTVEFYVYTDDNTTLSNNTLDFELKEKSNPAENIEVDIRRLDKNNYVVRAEVPKKWTVLSLGVSSFNPLEISTKISTDLDESNNNKSNTVAKNTTVKNTVKFYSEFDDMKKVNELEMKTSEKYLSEFTDLEIESLNKKVVDINKLIQEKNTVIDAYSENINRLNEDKAYQTDSEQQATNTKISSIETIINNEKENINKLNQDKRELKDKIRKLEDKKKNLLDETK